MMEEQDLRRIPETAYLNAENAARYRAILRFCYRRHEHMQTFVYPEEIFRELAQTSFFAAYTEEQLAQDLAQLEAWGNLTAQQEVARAHNIAEFKRKRFRYQCTPYTVEIERMVERLRGLGDSFGGSLETTQFDRLLSHLSSLLLDAAGQSDEQLLQTWEDLLHYFRTLVENASDYLAHLRSAKVEERMQTSAFLAYKDMFTQYLRSFVLGLQRAAQQVSALLEQAEDETLQAVFGRLADRWHIIHALDESASREAYLAEVRERWQVLREWFLGTEYHASELSVLGDETIETLRRITRFAQRIAQERQTLRSRKAEYLDLAGMFLACEGKREADALASVVFGASRSRHFQVAPRASEDIHGHIEAEPPMVVPLTARRRGAASRRHVSAVRDRSEEKAAALAAYTKRQAELREMLASLVVDGEIDFAHLPVLRTEVRRALLSWVDRCLPQRGKAVALENGARMRLVLDSPSVRVCVRSEDGDLWMPALRLVMEDAGETGGLSDGGR